MTNNQVVVHQKTRLIAKLWRLKNGKPSICIRQGAHYINISIANARELVHAVHDLADLHDYSHTAKPSSRQVSNTKGDVDAEPA